MTPDTPSKGPRSFVLALVALALAVPPAQALARGTDDLPVQPEPTSGGCDGRVAPVQGGTSVEVGVRCADYVLVITTCVRYNCRSIGAGSDRCEIPLVGECR